MASVEYFFIIFEQVTELEVTDYIGSNYSYFSRGVWSSIPRDGYSSNHPVLVQLNRPMTLPVIERIFSSFFDSRSIDESYDIRSVSSSSASLKMDQRIGDYTGSGTDNYLKYTSIEIDTTTKSSVDVVLDDDEEPLVLTRRGNRSINLLGPSIRDNPGFVYVPWRDPDEIVESDNFTYGASVVPFQLDIPERPYVRRNYIYHGDVADDLVNTFMWDRLFRQYVSGNTE